jgi:hypothetical protein
MIPVSWTGVLPKYCPPHYQQSIAPKAQAANSEWRLKTIDIQCSHPICENLQHPSAHGWCHYHYTIWTVHNLDAEGWWTFYNDQNGRCPICGATLLNGTIIAIDHDHVAQPKARHKKEHARGLLHAAPCNGLILGGIETAIANGWFENALRYIHFDL